VDTALLAPAVEPLSFLLGTWTGQGRGAYPTIDDFVYAEETTFLCPDKPVVAYRQQTWVPPAVRHRTPRSALSARFPTRSNSSSPRRAASSR
jgi:hypothetical protein